MRKHIYLSLAIIAVILVGSFLFIRVGGDKDLNNTINIVPVAGIESHLLEREDRNVLSSDGQLENHNMKALIKTNFGEITLEFFEEDAPNTVSNFVNLAQSGFYNGTRFHRVVAGFMIQGGDPLSKDETQKDNWGRGGPGYTFADEIHSNNLNVRGTISMANSGVDTNGSQFFINVADNNFLDSKHTVFGRVTEGFEVVNAIENVQTGNSDRPVEDILIESIIII